MLYFIGEFMKLYLSLMGLCILLICIIFKIKKRNSLKYRLSKNLNHELIFATSRSGLTISNIDDVDQKIK